MNPKQWPEWVKCALFPLVWLLSLLLIPVFLLLGAVDACIWWLRGNR